MLKVMKNYNHCKVNKVWRVTVNSLLIAVTSLLLFLNGCKVKQTTNHIDRAFYFWKSTLELSTKEATSLQQLAITKLYVKLFDVDWDAEKQMPQPIARVEIDSGAVVFLQKQNIEIIPVVFITNESLHTIDSLAIPDLAKKITNLTSIIQQKEKLFAYSELQLDCDWNLTTKNKYFLLLAEIKKQMKQSLHSFAADAKLSATIRLHQIKYSSKTGVPNVDKGLLMCYNMGNLKNPSTNNSILDFTELEKYLGNLHKYPLELDIALPLFEWHVLYNKNLYKGIISTISNEQLKGCGTRTGNRFTFSIDTTLNNVAFKKGDLLRTEESNKEEILKCITHLQKKLKQNTQIFTVSFFHLDELILNKHPNHELEVFYNSFY